MSDTPVLHIDLESRSTVDLKKSGAYVYAEHPTTDIWVACFAIDDSPIGVWFPGQPVPELLREHVLAGHPIYAHNANFERIMWREILGPRYGWPVPELEQFYCTAAMAAAMNLPRDLEGAAQALGLPVQKDTQGRNLMLRMAKPRRPRKGEPRDVVLWWDDEERVQRLTEYCKTDVEVERLIEQRLRHLSQAERQVYLLDARINDRGVLVDIETVHRAAEVVEKALKRLDREMAEATGGAVTGCSQVSRLAEWINWRGIDCTGVGKDQLAALLERDDLPDDVRLALSIRQEAAKSSTSKLNAFMAQRCRDGSAKGQLLYHGAGTGRWAGRGVQLQNLPRPMMRRPELAIPALQSGDDRVVDLLWDRPMQVVSDCIRSMVIARPGKRFICADFSNIEGRGVAWLAGEKKKLRAFKAFDEGTGPDLYLVAASGIYGIPLSNLNKNSPERQIGKVAELACGYQGGVGAFQAMAKVYGVKVEDEFADEIKTKWRDSNPRIVRFWWDVNAAAFEAVANPGRAYECRDVSFVVKSDVLWCRLPSGRLLAYMNPRIKEVYTPWGEKKPSVTFMAINSRTKKWERHKGYGGLFVENITQAVARDIMVDSMLRAEKEGYPILLTVHDEILAEVDEGVGSVKELEQIMEEPPKWAKGFPIAAEGWEGLRYRK